MQKVRKYNTNKKSYRKTVNHNHPLNLITTTQILQEILPTLLLKWKVTHICHRWQQLLCCSSAKRSNCTTCIFLKWEPLKNWENIWDHQIYMSSMGPCQHEVGLSSGCSGSVQNVQLREAVTKRSGTLDIWFLLIPQQESFLYMTKAQTNWNMDPIHLRPP